MMKRADHGCNSIAEHILHAVGVQSPVLSYSSVCHCWNMLLEWQIMFYSTETLAIQTLSYLNCGKSRLKIPGILSFRSLDFNYWLHHLLLSAQRLLPGCPQKWFVCLCFNLPFVKDKQIKKIKEILLLKFTVSCVQNSVKKLKAEQEAGYILASKRDFLNF